MANVCRGKRFASHQPSAPSVARTAFALVNGDWKEIASSQDEATELLGGRLGRLGGVRIWAPGKGRVDRLHARSRPEAHLAHFFSVLSLFHDLQRSTGD